MDKKYNLHTFFLHWMWQRIRLKSTFNKSASIVFASVGAIFGSKLLFFLGVFYFLFDALTNQWYEYRKREAYEGWLKSEHFKNKQQYRENSEKPLQK